MRILAVVLLAVVTSTAAAQDFNSMPDVPEARKEIAAMPERELRGLLAYVAECSPRTRASAQPCAAAFNRYTIEFGQGFRAIDRVVIMSEQTQKLKLAIDGGVAPFTTFVDEMLQQELRKALSKLR